MKMSTTVDFRSFIEGYAFAILMLKYNINSYPTRLKNGIELFKNDYEEISAMNNNKKLTLTKEQFEGKFKDQIEKEFKYIQIKFLKAELHEYTKENSSFNPKGKRTLSCLESKSINKFYLYNNQMYKINRIKENKDFVTIETTLKSGRKHVYRMTLNNFSSRKLYQEL